MLPSTEDYNPNPIKKGEKIVFDINEDKTPTTEGKDEVKRKSFKPNVDKKIAVMMSAEQVVQQMKV